MGIPLKVRSLLPANRWRRHFLLCLAALALVSNFYVLLGFSPEKWVDIPDRKAEDVQWRLSMSLAYSALLFLTVTLTIGPVNAIRNRPVPANNMLRRDIAIWTGALALAHLSVGIWIHTSGWKLWGLFFWSLPGAHHPFPLRKDLFGLANFAGLAQALIMILLLLLSNNLALRRLGVRVWKNLQRLSYLAFGLVILHGFAYQSVERRIIPMRLFFFSLVSLVLVLQVLGFSARLLRRRRRKSSIPAEPFEEAEPKIRVA